VQDVFLKIWVNRKDLLHVDNPSAYIYRMAANGSSDFLRKKAREVKLQYYIARHQEKGINFTEQWTDFHISENLYKEALNKLSPQRARVYRMKYEEGMNYVEIMRYLKISKNTIRNHLVAAMDHLRNYLLKAQRPS
jgi:RNA polymerase sigma-70 factor (ECF subfamily)